MPSYYPRDVGLDQRQLAELEAAGAYTAEQQDRDRKLREGRWFLDQSVTLDEAVRIARSGDRDAFPTALMQLRQQAADAEREGRAAAAGVAVRPSVAATPAAAAPHSNTGGADSHQTVSIVLSGGKVKEVMVRKPGFGQCAILDWVNFTISADTCWNLGARTPAPRDMVIALSARLADIFGFPVTRPLPSGRNFYDYAFDLGDGYGTVCIGGQRGTVLVMLNGTGITAAKEGWERRLYDFLRFEAVCPRLTRVDCAYDDFTGESYSVDRAKADHAAGLYTCHVMEPDCEERGAWKRPSGKGRSFYVGHRANGKFARVYEKGMQLGHAFHPWVRVEVEFKAVDRVIPFEILLHPGEYLAAAYPALAFLQEKQTRIETYRREADCSYTAVKDWLKRQCGPALDFMLAVEGSAERVLELVRRDVIPGRMARYIIHDEFKPIESITFNPASWEEALQRAFIS
ncbi:replication initiation factor domain-containing protein [Chitinimonas koreensis]|uniref:replication initiation factor domain-containing protein n=2 Tax=Chitinimonas koreensis TaxID=356302 RepID=UPI000686EFE2|nr:replication initiation factor domain-containing protein [Chitinimonas koreensis]